MNAIVLVIDRLHAGYIGAYGNTWIKTPAIDRLAAGSMLFEQAMIDSPELERLYRSYWLGRHALSPAEGDANVPSLAELLRGSGVLTGLVSDEPALGQLPAAERFERVAVLDPPWRPRIAAEVHETHFGRCFVETLNWLQKAPRDKNYLLWCHLGGLGTSWDAPSEFRRMYCEPGDPLPPDGPDVPDRALPKNFDPDELLGMVQSYAGQVSLLDACLGALGEFLDGLDAAGETLLALTSARGFPLGEHGRVGACGESLYGELTHVPLLLRFPDGAAASVRCQSLVEPADLWATLLEWFGVKPPGSPTAMSLCPLARGDNLRPRDRLCMVNRHEGRAIRTPAWRLITGARPELYAQPDDRWEVNDVASLCPAVVEGLQIAIEQFEQILSDGGRIADAPPLEDILVHGVE
jgi:hypothetical protein